MEYLTGDMAAFYTQPEVKGKRGSGPKNQLSMALELYVDKPAVSWSFLTYVSFCLLVLFSSWFALGNFKPVEKGVQPLRPSWARMSLDQSDMQ